MDELAQELQKIPITKAVAWHCLPGICWKTQAISVAAFIYPKLQVWRGQNPIFVPPQWKVAHLTFVHKPAKTLDRKCHLRPLALLEPVGKSILGLITAKVATCVQPLLCRWPELAFMPKRSPFDAIRRVVQHCVSIRHLTMQQRRSVHQRADNVPCRPVCGIQVFLGVLGANKAFDMLPRHPFLGVRLTLNPNSTAGGWRHKLLVTPGQPCAGWGTTHTCPPWGQTINKSNHSLLLHTPKSGREGGLSQTGPLPCMLQLHLAYQSYKSLTKHSQSQGTFNLPTARD